MVSDEWRAGRSGRFDPFSGFVDVGVGADGAYDGASRDRDFARVLDDSIERETEIPFAPSPEAGGMGMAVNGLAVGEIVLVGHNVGTAPMEESCLDGASLRVAADTALARVTVKICGASPAVDGAPCGCFVGFCGFAAHASR